jgi:hypothetical protein
MLLEIPERTTYALKQYRSSPNVIRYFCQFCGETALYRNIIAGKGVLVDVSLRLLQVPGDEKDWFVGEYHDTDEQAVSEIDRYIEGWMEGRCSFEEEGKEFLGAEFVEEVSRQWRQRWALPTA